MISTRFLVNLCNIHCNIDNVLPYLQAERSLRLRRRSSYCLTRPHQTTELFIIRVRLHYLLSPALSCIRVKLKKYLPPISLDDCCGFAMSPIPIDRRNSSYYFEAPDADSTSLQALSFLMQFAGLLPLTSPTLPGYHRSLKGSSRVSCRQETQSTSQALWLQSEQSNFYARSPETWQAFGSVSSTDTVLQGEQRQQHSSSQMLTLPLSIPTAEDLVSGSTDQRIRSHQGLGNPETYAI